MWLEHALRVGVMRDEGFAHLIPHLKSRRSDTWAQPNTQVFGLNVHRLA
jgi:hypothetical protein